jgi:hypothetical protein
VGGIRELGGGVVTPDDHILHILDLGAALASNLRQGSVKIGQVSAVWKNLRGPNDIFFK